MLSQSLKNTLSKLNSLTAIMASGVQRFSRMHHIVTVHFIHLLYTAEQIQIQLKFKAGNKIQPGLDVSFPQKLSAFSKLKHPVRGWQENSVEAHLMRAHGGAWLYITTVKLTKGLLQRPFWNVFEHICLWMSVMLIGTDVLLGIKLNYILLIK